MYKVLSSGKKIKKIRKELGISQNEIAGKEISRSLISQIENEKVNLTEKTARIIIDNINNYIIKSNLNINKYNYEFILTCNENEANNIGKSIVEELVNLDINFNLLEFNHKMLYIEDFLNKYQDLLDYSLLINIYEHLIDIYYKLEDLENGEYYIFKSTEIAMKNKDYNKMIKILAITSKRYFYVKNYTEVISCCNYAIILAKEHNISNDSLKKVYFNISIAYLNLKEHNKCERFLNILITDFNLNNKEYIDVQITKAICFKENKNYMKAEHIYMTLLERLVQSKINYDLICNIYTNLSDIYNEIKNYNKRDYYINLALQASSHASQDRKACVYEYILLTYINSKSIHEVKCTLNITIDLLVSCKFNTKLENVILKTFNFFLENNYNDMLDELMIKLDSIIDRFNYKNIVNIYFIVANHFNIKSNKGQKYFEKGLNYIKLK